MSILFVTSFNKKIYQISGVRLILSYLKFKIDSDLLITYEGNNLFLDNLIKKHERIKYYNLNNYDYLNNWLKENEDIIPTKYGGKYKPYQFNNEIDVKLLNKFNMKASLWFRKIASLKYALDNYKNNYKYIIWIDADAFFIQNLSNQYVYNIFNNTYCFYHLGLYRAIKTLCSVESGLIGFKSNDGYKLLYEIIDKYNNKEFMKYERWDDGHIIGNVIIDSDIKTYDVINSILEDLNVMNFGPFKDYIKHLKGTHHIKEKMHNNVINYKNYEELILKY